MNTDHSPDPGKVPVTPFDALWDDFPPGGVHASSDFRQAMAETKCLVCFGRGRFVPRGLGYESRDCPACTLAVQLAQVQQERDEQKEYVKSCADMIPDEQTGVLAGRIANLQQQLAQAQGEVERLREEVDWQNAKNRNPAAHGAFEFYINEEWTGIARVALDDTNNALSIATLSKRRYDPDDERVRVRRVNADDALIAELATVRAECERLSGQVVAQVEANDRILVANHHLRAENAELRDFAREVREFVARYSPSQLSFGVLATKADAALAKHQP